MDVLHPESSQRQKSERRQPSCQEESDDLRRTLLLTGRCQFCRSRASAVSEDEFDDQEEFQEATQGLAWPSENQDDTGQHHRTINDPSVGHYCLNYSRQVLICRNVEKAFSVIHAQPRSVETASIERFGKAYDEDESSGSYRDEGIRRLMSQRMRLRSEQEYRDESTLLKEDRNRVESTEEDRRAWVPGETRRIAKLKRAANNAVRKWNENLRRYCAVQPLERIEDVARGDLLVFSGGAPVRFDRCALSLAVDRSGGVLRVARLVEEEQPPHRLEVSDLRLDASALKGAAVVRFQPQDCLSSEKTVRLAKSFAAENDWVLELGYSEACRLFASWCKTGSIRRRVPILFYDSPVIVATAAVSAIAAITGAAYLFDFLRSTFRDVA